MKNTQSMPMAGFRASKETMRQISVFAVRNGMSKSDAIRHLIEKGLSEK